MPSTTTYVARVACDVLEVEGRDRVDLLHRLSTQDLKPLGAPGAVREALFVTDKGKLIDWVSVYALEERLLVRAAPGRGARLAEWIERYTIVEDVRCVDVSPSWAMLLLQGEEAAQCAGLERMPDVGESVVVGGVRWSRGPSAYGLRLEGLVETAAAAAVAEALEDRGAVSAAPEQLERWRIEAGVPSAEHEYKEPVIPLELRLGERAVSWTKGCFIGQEVLNRIDSKDKLSRVLVGFELPASARTPWAATIEQTGETVGAVTSVARAEDGHWVGLGLVKRKALGEGALSVVDDGARVDLELRERPFWQ